MGELDHKEGWAPNYWCFWTVVLEKTLESPLDCKEIKPVNHKGNQPWIFFGSTDAEAPIFCPPAAKSQLIEKDSAAGKVWRQKKWAADDKMVKQYHWLNGHEFEQPKCKLREKLLRSAQSLSCVQLFVTPWTAAHQTSLSITNSRSLSHWCHPAISSSVVPYSSCLQSFPAPGSFQMSQFFKSGGQSGLEFQLRH